MVRIGQSMQQYKNVKTARVVGQELNPILKYWKQFSNHSAAGVDPSQIKTL